MHLRFPSLVFNFGLNEASDPFQLLLNLFDGVSGKIPLLDDHDSKSLFDASLKLRESIPTCFQPILADPRTDRVGLLNSR